MPREVGRDDPEAIGERGDGVLPVLVRGTEPVQEQERGTRAGLGDVQLDAVDDHVAPLDAGHHPRSTATVYATVGGGSCGAPP